MSLMEQAANVSEHAGKVESSLASGHYLAALRHADRLADTFSHLVGDIAQAAFEQGATKKAIAAALGVPPSTLRGMVKSGR